MDAFAELGLPREFDLAPMRIQRAYLARAGEADATEDSSLESLNRAKSVLMNPEERANALLALMGGPTKEQDRSLPPSFLPEIMGIREEVEASLASGDAAQRAEWRAWAEARRAEHAARVSELFKCADGTPDVLKKVRVELNAWRYTERLIEQLDSGG